MILKIKELPEKLRQSKYLPLLFVLGIALMLLPVGTADKTEAPAQVSGADTKFDLSAQERRLEKVLSGIDGAGDVSVLLSVKSSQRRVLARDSDETVVISAGSGTEEVVELISFAPEYQGAVIVCRGGDRADVRLAVTNAVRAYTGLGSDKITVIKMKS